MYAAEMRRAIILLLWGAAAFVVVLPFMMTARAREERGILLPGRVDRKSEALSIRYGDWRLRREAVIQYRAPDAGASLLYVEPNEAQYDTLRTGQAVQLRYLLRRDVPNVPLAGFFWQLHALPVAALESPPISWLSSVLTPGVILGARLLAGLLALVAIWRITRAALAAWAVGAVIACGIVWLFVQGFPRATPAPRTSVRHATAHVQSISHIDALFDGQRSRGLDANQPIDVVAFEFLPEGRTDPVVAVDLIDRGSVPVQVESAVAIDYEANSPRTAYLAAATRTFPARNFQGAVVQCALVLGVLLTALLIIEWIRRRIRRMVDPERLAALRKSRWEQRP